MGTCRGGPMVRCAPYMASIAAPSTCADECQNTCDVIDVEEGMRGSLGEREKV